MCATPNDISGTWFPSGFHGHFRSKTRTDFTIPYRQRAKPVPPQKFLNYTKERSNSHLFSRHDNRNAHSNMGDLEAFFNMGLGKRKFVTSSQAPSQHNKNTRDLITWRGNDTNSMVTTYRSHFERSSTPSTGWNEAEPIHIRSNLQLKRRHYRAASAPPSHQRAPPLLAWNDIDETYSSKPGVGSRTLRTQMAFERPSSITVQNTPNTSSNSNYTVSETVTPLTC